MGPSFSLGQRVVCVNHRFWRVPMQGEAFPEIGNIYTVRAIDSDADGQWLRFHEVVNPTFNIGAGPIEASFTHLAFRPLDERRLDQFRAHLQPKALLRRRQEGRV